MNQIDEPLRLEIYNADVLDFLNMLEVNSRYVDVFVTSPPYNLNIKYGTTKDNAPRLEYLDWTRKWLLAANRVMYDDGSMFLNLAGSPSNPMLPFEVASILIEAGWQIQNVIHWVKSVTLEDDDGVILKSVGHFKPLNTKRYLNSCHEYVFHLVKYGKKVDIDRLAVGVPYADKSNIARFGQDAPDRADVRCRGNVWHIPYTTIQSKDKQRPHPATFPVRLASRCLDLVGAGKDTVVCDPFNGIGNTSIAAGMKRCMFVGCDIDKDYCEKAMNTALPLFNYNNG